MIWTSISSFFSNEIFIWNFNLEFSINQRVSTRYFDKLDIIRAQLRFAYNRNNHTSICNNHSHLCEDFSMHEALHNWVFVFAQNVYRRCEKLFTVRSEYIVKSISFLLKDIVFHYSIASRYIIVIFYCFYFFILKLKHELNDFYIDYSKLDRSHFKIEARNELKLNIVEWIINVFVKKSLIVQSFHDKYVDMRLIDINVFVKMIDIMSETRHYERDLNKTLSFLLKTIDFAHRFFIVDISNFTSLLYWEAIATRFKKSIFTLLMNNIFDFINQKLALDDVEIFNKVIESF